MDTSSWHITKLSKHGTGFYVNIPRELRRGANLVPNQYMVLKLVDNSIVVAPFDLTKAFRLNGVYVDAAVIVAKANEVRSATP